MAAVAAILGQVFLGVAAGFTVGIALGGVYGALTYDWALGGESRLRGSTQAIDMSRREWARAHALMFGAFGAVAGGLASIAPVAMIAVGGLGIAWE